MAAPRVEIKNRLVELAKLRRKEARIQKQFDKAIQPHEDEYLQNRKPIDDIYEPKLSPVREEISTIEKEISEQMLSTKQGDGSLKFTRVESDEFVVEANATTRRIVKAKDFYDAVQESKRDAKFWDCLTTGIAKAEKFLGEGIDAIASVKRNWKVSIRKKKKSKS